MDDLCKCRMILLLGNVLDKLSIEEEDLKEILGFIINSTREKEVVSYMSVKILGKLIN